MTARRLAQALIASAAMLAGAAQATTVYTFDSTAVSDFGAGPFGTVTLTQNGANVDVTVTLRNDMDFVVTGGPHVIFGMNLAGAVAGDITNIVFNGGSNGTIGVTTNQAVGGFGTFAFAIDCTRHCTEGANGALRDPLSFRVTNALEADFAHDNSKDAYFVADVLCLRSSNLRNCRGETGSIAATRAPSRSDTDSDTDTDVPEPGTLALLGLGLIGLGASRRRKA